MERRVLVASIELKLSDDDVLLCLASPVFHACNVEDEDLHDLCEWSEVMRVVFRERGVDGCLGLVSRLVETLDVVLAGLRLDELGGGS